jgi:hypothetical protein
VVLKDEGDGITKEAITNDSGLFLFPNLDHGEVSGQVTLQGFQTAQRAVVVDASRTTDLRVMLQPGGLTES